MSINRVTITGNLTRDPEARVTGGGTYVLSFGVAVNDRRRKQRTGEWEDYANFVECTMFGNRAEAVSRYLAKGSKVALEGKLRYSSWEKDGQRRSKLEVVVDEIEFMSRANGDGRARPVQQAQTTAGACQQPQPVAAYVQEYAESAAHIPASQYQAVQPQAYDVDAGW